MTSKHPAAGGCWQRSVPETPLDLAALRGSHLLTAWQLDVAGSSVLLTTPTRLQLSVARNVLVTANLMVISIIRYFCDLRLHREAQTDH
jgi:hypothetical protein